MTEVKDCIGCDGVLKAQPEAEAALSDYISGLAIGDDPERNRGYLIQCLHKAQQLFGFLPESVQLYVANKLKVHMSEVYGVISFYSFFTDTPKGEHRINVCTGTACFVRGAQAVQEEFARLLGIEEGETTEDNRFSLGGLRCVGACSLAPVVLVNDKVYGNVTTGMVQEILNDCE
ncbi:MAG: NAD(P)H-dependent oxidoreductase subunit E [Spirochaetales bacterium]|jgi:NADH-quinone oxidoreductase subunit E|nr:NAD(P)H-dependent oxidoreductase subunit E [Spirochaetales bacterium]